MEARRLVAGTLGVATAAAWATLIVAQLPRYTLGASVLTLSGQPLGLRALASASLLLGGAGLLCVGPMLVAGAAVMLRLRRADGVLRACAQAGAAAAALLVLAVDASLLPSLPAGRAWLGAGAATELAGATTLLLLHLGVVQLLRPRADAAARAVA